MPTVLTCDEVRLVLNELDGLQKMIAAMLYGSGLRSMEALTLSVKDLDFEYQTIHVHNAKGAKDRIVTFPSDLGNPVRLQLEQARLLHRADLARGRATFVCPMRSRKSTLPRPGTGHGST